MENAQEETVVEQQAPSLTLNDLGALANIINVATKRGAFNANELTNVGSVYDKLNAFITAAQAAQNVENPAPEAATDPV